MWFGVPWPQDPIAYVAAFVLGMSSLFAIGLLLAAVAPSSRVATAMAIPLFFVVMLLGGVYLPRYFLPEILVTIGDFTPPGVQGLQDAWLGAAPQLLPARRAGRHHPRRRSRRQPRLPVGMTDRWSSVRP